MDTNLKNFYKNYKGYCLLFVLAPGSGSTHKPPLNPDPQNPGVYSCALT
jgi:hypothetical protein